MKIISLQAENLKRLSAVEIKPDGNMVLVTGRNAQGKTSVLDSIAWAIEGAKNIQSQPIRTGWTKARIRLDLGELVVSRVFNRQEDGSFTTSVSVTNGEGARYPSPQSMLDGLLGALSFDPLAFSRMKPREQFDALRQFVPGIDFDKLDAEHKADYQARAEASRRAKDLKAQADAIAVPADLPDRVDESELVDQLEEAGKHNAGIEANKANRANMARSVDTHKASAQAARDRAVSYRKMADEQDAIATAADERAATVQQQLDSAGPVPEPIDSGVIRAMIQDARTINAHHDRAERRAGLLTSAAMAEAAALELTHAMARRETTKQEAIAAAKLPVDGLGFGDGIVTLAGVPFDQGSDAEQLRASVALAMAANPTLRVIRVRDGSLLDENSLKLIAEMADEKDCQVWVEKVDSSGSVGVVIEDGHVKWHGPAAVPVASAAPAKGKRSKAATFTDM